MDITPKYLGDDLVLLHGLSEIGAERVMNGGTYGNASLFYSMERWNPSICTGNRMIWVQCWGIPLQTWDKKHIRQIVAVMGEVVNVNDDVETK